MSNFDWHRLFKCSRHLPRWLFTHGRPSYRRLCTFYWSNRSSTWLSRDACCWCSTTLSTVTLVEALSCSDVVGCVGHLHYLPIFGNPVLVIDLMLAFLLWLWRPVCQPAFTFVKTVYNIIYLCQMWLVLRPDQMPFTSNVFIKLFIVLRADLTVVVVSLWSRERDELERFSVNSFSHWALLDLVHLVVFSEQLFYIIKPLHSVNALFKCLAWILAFGSIEYELLDVELAFIACRDDSRWILLAFFFDRLEFVINLSFMLWPSE